MLGRCLFGQGPLGNYRVEPVEQGMRATSQNDGEIRDFGWRPSACGWDLDSRSAQESKRGGRGGLWPGAPEPVIACC